MEAVIEEEAEESLAPVSIPLLDIFLFVILMAVLVLLLLLSLKVYSFLTA